MLIIAEMIAAGARIARSTNLNTAILKLWFYAYCQNAKNLYSKVSLVVLNSVDGSNLNNQLQGPRIATTLCSYNNS